jgi:preprotein translocase subunit YajC
MMPSADGKMDYSFLIMMGGVFVIMYFFMIRPQSKKMREQRDYISSMQKGDKVVTTGGIHGKINQIDDKTVLIEIDTNVKMKIEKNGISVEMTKALTEAKNPK